MGAATRRAHAVLGISLALSLMWVSIEKFVYPHWTLCVMQQHPIITFGFEPHAVTQLAGIVEFSLAFSLLWTPLIRRAAAVVLGVLMSAAILEFGKIDALGHIIPIALLMAIALSVAVSPAAPHARAVLAVRLAGRDVRILRCSARDAVRTDRPGSAGAVIEEKKFGRGDGGGKRGRRTASTIR